MDRRVAFALLGAGLVAAALPALQAAPQERHLAWDVTAIPCGAEVCLAYDGQIPGPTLDLRLGETVQLALTNRIAETLAAIPGVDAATRARLEAAAVSFHVHGMALAPDMDGVDRHDGTQLVRSVAEPGGTYVYRMRAAFAGTWHYHDHVLGADGAEGIARGLYGSVVVRPAGEPGARVLDLHLLDTGANGGRGLDAEVPAGAPFDVVVAGLDNDLWSVTLSNATWSQTVRVGPGMSERLHVDRAEGRYAWEALGGRAGAQLGEVVAS